MWVAHNAPVYHWISMFHSCVRGSLVIWGGFFQAGKLQKNYHCLMNRHTEIKDKHNRADYQLISMFHSCVRGSLVIWGGFFQAGKLQKNYHCLMNRHTEIKDKHNRADYLQTFSPFLFLSSLRSYSREILRLFTNEETLCVGALSPCQAWRMIVFVIKQTIHHTSSIPDASALTGGHHAEMFIIIIVYKTCTGFAN